LIPGIWGRRQRADPLLPGRLAQGATEHLDIIDAVISGDPVAAERITREHFASVVGCRSTPLTSAVNASAAIPLTTPPPTQSTDPLTMVAPGIRGKVKTKVEVEPGLTLRPIPLSSHVILCGQEGANYCVYLTANCAVRYTQRWDWAMWIGTGVAYGGCATG
jgi:FCD domain